MSTSAPVPFRALPIGARFRFTSESVPGYGGARGPWRKLSPRRYVRDDGTAALVCKVGTVRVECHPIPPTRAEVCATLGANVFGRLDHAAGLIERGEFAQGLAEVRAVAGFLSGHLRTV